MAMNSYHLIQMRKFSQQRENISRPLNSLNKLVMKKCPQILLSPQIVSIPFICNVFFLYHVNRILCRIISCILVLMCSMINARG